MAKSSGKETIQDFSRLRILEGEVRGAFEAKGCGRRNGMGVLPKPTIHIGILRET
jgi:hypothetical protein